MMPEQLLRASTVLTISLLLATGSLTGCRRKTVAPGPSEAELEIQQIRSADGHPAPFYNGLPDNALLAAHEVKGIELALKMDTSSYPAGAPIPFHILIRDEAATVPIAAGLCSGLSLAWQKLDDNTDGTAAIDNQRCFNTIPSPDETPLVRGAIKTVEITQVEASHTTFAPGRYLLNLSWQPYQAGRGTIMGRQPYATLKSNVILFTVTP